MRPGHVVRPYGLVGVGQSRIRKEINGSSVRDSSHALQGAAGARVHLGNSGKAAVRAEVAFLTNNAFGERSTYHTLQSGMSWRF